MMGPKQHVAFLGAWNNCEKSRADQMVAILARLNVDVACVIQTDWGGLDVVTQQEMRAYDGREHLLLASKYNRLITQHRLA
jgi:hypothetical protein